MQTVTDTMKSHFLYSTRKKKTLKDKKIFFLFPLRNTSECICYTHGGNPPNNDGSGR